MSQFNFTIQHVDGNANRVADYLSCYYKTDGPEDVHPAHEFMSADAWLNPDGELLPIQHYVELHTVTLRCSCHLADKPEKRLIKSNQMNRDVIETVP